MRSWRPQKGRDHADSLLVVSDSDPTATEQSRILLPLRTSVDLFSDPSQPSALTRAKQAAVLYDAMTVEMGFLDVSMTPHGGSTTWKPPEMIDEHDIRRARMPPEQGAPMSWAVGVQPSLGVPADKMTTVMQGEISMAYAAEWHSEVLAPLQALGADFVEVIVTPGGDIPRDNPVGEAIARQNFSDMGDESLVPGVNTFERDFIYKSFNRDEAVAEDLGAVLQVSTLFEPMLERHGWKPTGATALGVLAPNLESLEWEQVLEFREHPGAGEARSMLRNSERIAVEQEPQDAREFLTSTFQGIGEALFGVIEARSMKLGRATTEEVAKDAVSILLPPVAMLIGAANLVEDAAAARSQSRSGIAALMKLRRG